MRQAASTLLVLSLVLAFSVPPVLACGDKFLVVGRGVRYREAYASSHPASILLWLPSDAATRGRVEARLDLEHHLRLAGHKVRLVTDRQQFLRELRDGRFDLVIASWDDALSLVPDGRPSPPVLAIGNGRSEVGSRFSTFLDNRDNPEHALTVVDYVLKRATTEHR